MGVIEGGSDDVKGRTTRGTRRVLYASIAALPLGCATIGEELARTEVETLKQYERQVDTQNTLVVARQTGRTVTFHTAKECMRLTTFEKRTTNYFEDVNQSKGGDYASLGFGLAFAGVGGAMIVDARNGAQSDPNHTLFGKLDAKQEYGLGIASAALGGLLILIPVVDGFRALGGREDVRDFKEDGPTVAPSEVCGYSSRAPNAVAVSSSLLSTPLDMELQSGDLVATTMVRLLPSGAVPLDFGPLVPDSLLRASARPSRLRFSLGSTTVAEVDAMPAYRFQDDSMWADLSAARSACDRPRALGACDEVRAYAARYPESFHRRAAVNLVNAAEPTFAAIRDDIAFDRANAPACSAGAHENACDGVRDYLDRMPSGRHAAEARAALFEGTPKVLLLAAQREAAEAEAERQREAELARLAEERRLEEERAAAEQRLAEMREEAERRLEEERAAAEQRELERREAEARRQEERREAAEAARRRRQTGQSGQNCGLWQNLGRGAGQGLVCSKNNPFVRGARVGACRCPN